MHSLSSVTPEIIGIKEKLRLTPKAPVDMTLSDSKLDLPYGAAIQKILEISEHKTITQKLRCLVDASKTIGRCIDEFYNPPVIPDPTEENSEDSANTPEEPRKKTYPPSFTLYVTDLNSSH